jgi:hypothetical protein
MYRLHAGDFCTGFSGEFSRLEATLHQRQRLQRLQRLQIYTPFKHRIQSQGRLLPALQRQRYGNGAVQPLSKHDSGSELHSGLASHPAGLLQHMRVGSSMVTAAAGDGSDPAEMGPDAATAI